MDETRRRFLGAVAAAPWLASLTSRADEPVDDEEESTESSWSETTSTSFSSLSVASGGG